MYLQGPSSPHPKKIVHEITKGESYAINRYHLICTLWDWIVPEISVVTQFVWIPVGDSPVGIWLILSQQYQQQPLDISKRFVMKI